MKVQKKEENTINEDSKEDSKKLIFSIIAVIMLFLILLFLVPNIISYFSGPEIVTIDDLHKMNLEGEETERNFMYNGFSFVKFDNMWYTQVQRNNILFDVPLHFNPRQLENISVFGSLDERFEQKKIYVTFDPDEDNLQYVALSVAELSRNIIEGMGLMPVASCTTANDSACIDRPIVDCENSSLAVIYMKQSNSTSVELKGNCAVISGREWDIVRSTDRFLYTLAYQIMD